MTAVYHVPDREGQSPFALAAGNRFERALFDNGAARLLELYRKAGRLTTAECKIVILPDLAPRATAADMARRRSETDRLFALKVRRHPSAPNLIVKSRVPVTLLGVPHDTEPDLLVASDSDAFYRPVEIKSYPDRAGKTSAADIRSACRQAAVGVVGLRQAITRLRLGSPLHLVPAIGDLVLRQPGSFFPTLTAMPLKGEVHSLERALDEAPRNLDELETLLASIRRSASLDDPSILDAISGNYIESCREHCALAPRCKALAVAAADPVLIGGTAREELAGAGSLTRALDLLHDRSRPRTPQEEALAVRLKDALGEYRRAVGNGR
jgi:hypothetical protein